MTKPRHVPHFLIPICDVSFFLINGLCQLLLVHNMSSVLNNSAFSWRVFRDVWIFLTMSMKVLPQFEHFVDLLLGFVHVWFFPSFTFIISFTCCLNESKYFPTMVVPLISGFKWNWSKVFNQQFVILQSCLYIPSISTTIMSKVC